LDFDPLPTTAASVVPFEQLNRNQRNALRRQAKQEYRQVRGYTHLSVLMDGYKRLAAQRAQTDTARRNMEEQLQALEHQQRSELQAALEYHLLRARLDEVEGIGEGLKARILSETGARTFAELQRAESISGVGESRRTAIDSWIRQYQEQLPQLLAQPFPGRIPIDRKYTEQIGAIRRAVEHQRQIAGELQRRLSELEPHIGWLSAITPQTYANAAAGSADAQAAAARFTLGLFAAGEPAPEWYRALSPASTDSAAGHSQAAAPTTR
jgi:hypothetical protein